MLKIKYTLLMTLLISAAAPACYKYAYDHTQVPWQPFSTGILSDNIPVLCYHNISVTGGKEDVYHISALHFDEQIKILHDSGYNAILPDQLYDYLTQRQPLPSRPVMITFDDTHETHASIAAPILEKYGFRGTFFIMTVCIGKKNYLTRQQIRFLYQKGHVIGCHSYDHPAVTTSAGQQWKHQVDEPLKQLEAITGTTISYYAYPFGIWNNDAITALKKLGIKAAFQLSEETSSEEPLYTVRRMLVSGKWSQMDLLKRIKKQARS